MDAQYAQLHTYSGAPVPSRAGRYRLVTKSAPGEGKLDRLGRSVKNLMPSTDELNTAGIGFRSLTDQIDTTSPV